MASNSRDISNGNGFRSGFGIRSWADLVGIVSLGAVAFGSISWGLKLESEINVIRAQVDRNTEQVSPLILPLAEARIDQLQQQTDRLEREIESLEERLQ